MRSFFFCSDSVSRNSLSSTSPQTTTCDSILHAVSLFVQFLDKSKTDLIRIEDRDSYMYMTLIV